MNTQDSRDRGIKYVVIFSVTAFVIVCLWLVNLVVVSQLLRYSNNWQSLGLVGDSFGSINALFSGLAFAGVLVTLWMQRDELALQREELKSQRGEVAKQVHLQRASMHVAVVQAVLSASDAQIRALQLTAVTAGKATATDSAHEAERVAKAMLEAVDELRAHIGRLETDMQTDLVNSAPGA